MLTTSADVRASFDLCFVPISAGGGIRSLDDAKKLMSSGADKLVLNTPLFENPALIKRIYQILGSKQLLLHDCLKENDNYMVYTLNGSKKLAYMNV